MKGFHIPDGILVGEICRKEEADASGTVPSIARNLAAWKAAIPEKPLLQTAILLDIPTRCMVKARIDSDNQEVFIVLIPVLVSAWAGANVCDRAFWAAVCATEASSEARRLRAHHFLDPAGAGSQNLYRTRPVLPENVNFSPAPVPGHEKPKSGARSTNYGLRPGAPGRFISASSAQRLSGGMTKRKAQGCAVLRWSRLGTVDSQCRPATGVNPLFGI